MRQRTAILLLLISCAFLSCSASEAGANIVIKVRALNPLEADEVASIRYPLPQEITPDHIIAKNIIYSLPKEEGGEQKATFNVEYVEDEAKYFIVDEIKMGPREVVTLEVHVQDIWSIADKRFSDIKKTVEDLVAQFPPEASSPDESGAESAQILSNQTAAALQDEIFMQLEEIAARQVKSSVLLVGVERHMEAYYENIEALAQVEVDVFMLRNILEPEEDDDAEGAEQKEASEEVTVLEEGALFDEPAVVLHGDEALEPGSDRSE